MFLMPLGKGHWGQVDIAPTTPFGVNPSIALIYNNCLAFQGSLVCSEFIKHSHLWILHLNAGIYQDDLSILYECRLTFWKQLV